MNKSVITISLFLIGTIFSVKAQEMTQKEKTGYAIGVILGEQIKEKIKESNIDLSVFESIKEKINEKVDFGSIKAGIDDILKGESKLSKDEIMSILAELEKEKENLEKILNANQSDGNEREAEKPESVVARTLGRLSWNYLFIKEYKKSEQSARQALKMDNTQIWVKVNLAHALLFQNRFSKAEKIYKELSQTIMKGNETYTQTLFVDLKELERAGVIPEKHKADVEKIRKMLQE